MASYLIADLHLSAQRPDLVRAFCDFCQQISDDATNLYILGDFFNIWIGDDYRDDTIDQINTALTSLKSKGCELFFMHGNRDFLVGKRYCKSVGMTMLKSDRVYQIEDIQAILAHGDEYCWDDTEYQSFRKKVRNPFIQFGYLSLPLKLRARLAKGTQNKAKNDKAQKSYDIMDVSQTAIDDAFTRHAKAGHPINLMIHGHTHRPKVHNGNNTRVVLGDWGKALWFVKVAGAEWSLEQQKIG